MGLYPHYGGMPLNGDIPPYWGGTDIMGVYLHYWGISPHWGYTPSGFEMGLSHTAFLTADFAFVPRILAKSSFQGSLYVIRESLGNHFFKTKTKTALGINAPHFHDTFSSKSISLFGLLDAPAGCF